MAEEFESFTGSDILKMLDSDKIGEEAKEQLLGKFTALGWKTADTEKIEVVGKDGIPENKEIRIRRPAAKTIPACDPVIDAETYELIMSTPQGMKRTGRKIKTVLAKPT